MPTDRGRSLKLQLVLLCLGVLLPTLFFVGILFWQLAASETDRADQQALASSHAMATALDREMVGVLTTLQALATSPNLQTGDLAGFYEQMAEMRRHQHIHIILRDPQSRVLLTTRAAPGSVVAVPPPLVAYDKAVLASNQPLITDMYTSTNSNASVFQIIAAPIRVRGEVTYLLGASLEPDYLSSAFRRDHLLPGWIGSLADRKFTSVARTVDQERYVGLLASPALREHAGQASSGVYRGLTIAGVQSLVGFTHSELTGWTASVNVPVELVMAPLRRSMVLLSGLGAALVLFAGLLTFSAGRRIIAATRQLGVAAGAIGDGRPVVAFRTPIAEINTVGEALSRASRQLEQRARERDAAEASVRDNEAHLSGIFAQTGAGLAEAELDGSIISANAQYCALVGRTEAQLRLMRLRDIPHPDDAVANEAGYRHVIETGQPITAEKRFVRGDGEIVWVANTLSLISGTRRTLLSVAIDISEQKRVEADLEAARDVAEQANMAKSTFIANMSHELRTPLSAIIGYSEMMKEEVADGADPAEFDGDLGKIESNARHLLGLINDVLDISKIESGKMEVFAETFDVEPVLRDVAATVGTLMGKKNNKLELDLQAGLGAMHSDLTKVRQILLNLLGNAAKFSENGVITLSARREDGSVVVGVRDRGIGMTEEQLGKLFQRFSQADASTTRRFGGTGLGLSITRAFTSMLGGSIDVTSQAGQGSCFTVRLPVGGPAPSPTPDGPADPVTREVVLVIDDDPAQRDITSRFLEREGFAARTASDGTTGIEMARQLRPRAILLDVTMPGLDGWSVLRLLKAEPELATIPVVMVTFIGDNGLAATLGAADHITKPVRWDMFRKTMDRFRDTEGDILVVDDDPDARGQIRAALERENWTVTEAANGRDALAKVAGRVPRVVLLDLEMPVMDGFSFLHAFHDVPGCRDVPVIVYTARDLSRADREALHGAAKVLNKGESSIRATAADLIAAARPHT